MAAQAFWLVVVSALILGAVSIRSNVAHDALRLGQTEGLQLVGFDFDCTLTVRHYYKVLAWCYANNRTDAHPHSEAFFDWCDKTGVVPGLLRSSNPNDIMESALDDFAGKAGEDGFREAVREVFLGGSSRITMIADWLEKMTKEGVEFAIVTAGTSTSVFRALTAVPEWQPYFPLNRVWDTSHSRHSIRSTTSMKTLMLRDFSPKASGIVLVDDSLGRDPPDSWVLQAAKVDAVQLPYEGSGVDEAKLAEIEKILFS